MTDSVNERVIRGSLEVLRRIQDDLELNSFDSAANRINAYAQWCGMEGVHQAPAIDALNALDSISSRLRELEEVAKAAAGPGMSCQRLRISGYRCRDSEWDPQRKHWCGNCILRSALDSLTHPKKETG
jgi:hypothetical protein